MHKKILIVICLLFMTTGCWNYNELNSLAITSAIAIDKKDNQYEVSILIANLKNKENNTDNNEVQSVVYSSKGNTISEAMKNIDLENPKKTYIGHLNSLIISKDVAEEGLVNVLDLFLKNSISSKRFFIVIAKDDKAKDILKIVSPLESFPTQTLSTNIKTSSQSQAVSTSVNYSDFIKTMLEKGINPVLPTIKIEGNKKTGSKNTNIEQTEPKGILKLDTLAIFNDDKLIGFATNDVSKGINLALNKTDSMIIKYKCKQDYLVTEINYITSKININNNKPTINIKATGNIIENNCDIDLNNQNTINDIKKDIKIQIKKLIKKGINYTQEEKVDVIGIGNLIYKKNPSYYNKIEDWNNYFSKLDIGINVDIDINYKNSTKKSLKGAINEN